MKLHPDQPAALNTVTAYGNGYIEINAQKHFGGIKVRPDGDVQAWAVCEIAEFDEKAVSELLLDAPEIILLGTGNEQKFPPAATLSELYRSQTGFEVMSTPAACRTYNILMAEGRHVLAALMPMA